MRHCLSREAFFKYKVNLSDLSIVGTSAGGGGGGGGGGNLSDLSIVGTSAGGGGGGGYSNLSLIRRLGPSIYCSPSKNIRNFKHPIKNI